MTSFLSRRLSRRKLLASSAGLAVSGVALAVAAPVQGSRHMTEAARASYSAAELPLPMEVMQHDEVQEVAAFARGTFKGTEVDGGVLKGEGDFESEVLTAPFAFTHVVMKWRGQLKGAAFEFRTSEDGQSWPDWRMGDIQAASVETTDTESLSGLVGAPRHRFLQYRARLKDGAHVSRITAIFLNTKDGPLIPMPPVPETGQPAAIDYSRAQWQCDERLRFEQSKEAFPRKYVPVTKLVVHHTVTPEEYDDGAAEVRAIYTYHARILGWGDIGYHALVDKFGNSYEGRHGTVQNGERQVFTPGVVGAHAFNHNSGSCGVSLIGHFHGADAPPVPRAMLYRLLDVLEHRARENHIDPLGVSDFQRTSGEWTRDMPNVGGHRDCVDTACPGDRAYSLMDTIRKRLAKRMFV